MASLLIFLATSGRHGGFAGCSMTLDVSRHIIHISAQMILSYADKRTVQFAKGAFVKAVQGFEAQAAKRLSVFECCFRFRIASDFAQ